MAKTTSINARILVASIINGHAVQPDRVATINQDIAEALYANGAIDTNADAIDYALTINPDIYDTTATVA